MSDRLSIVIPVYNSEQSIGAVVSQVRQALAPADLEFVLVDDGSVDGSWTVLEQLSRDPDVHAMRLARNFGQHNALLAGLRAATGSIVVTIDDDLQHDAADIPRLLAELDRGADVVYGAPLHGVHGFWRNAASWMTKLALQHAMGAQVATHVSAFRAFRRRLCDAFRSYDGAYVSIDVLLTWATNRFAWVEVTHHPRTIGKSNYDFRRLLRHALTMITGFSTLPLRIASFSGLAAMFLGVLLLLYVLVVFMLYGRAVPGFAFLASMMAILSGVQLFALGVMGEYLARMHVRLMERPAYVIAEFSRAGGP